MQSISLLSLIRIMLSGKFFLKFILGVIFSVAFSISVILATIGIMDGYDDLLKRGLKSATGDYVLTSYNGTFSFNQEIREIFESFKVSEITAFVQTEGFLVYKDQSLGVLIKGVDTVSFNEVTDLALNFSKQGIVIGKGLAQRLKIQEGDSVVLTLAAAGLPLHQRFKVEQIVAHGIYKKDMRFVYVEKKILSEILNIQDVVHAVSFNLPKLQSEQAGKIAGVAYQEYLSDFKRDLSAQLEDHLSIDYFWSEFSSLIEAVKVEKFSITLILQLIVIISVFNIMAFIIYINEKRSRELFLFQALGLGRKQITKMWIVIVLIVWMVACALSMIITEFFSLALENLEFFKMPGEIYNLTKLNILLSPSNYFIVFLLALVWVLLITSFGIGRMKKKSIIQGLRKEYV